ncbi:hypothetical protein VIBNIPon4_530038 [Vibrio nigripulchritudo POn4]|nr:hypothetical protein VIBNIAM115_1260077 [Vibrio nigripulchritudo AM115]CCN41953.1 hypothetical protein VIBNIFTn2_210206 [Vibrio nigripulchritudo FTn2]CCN66255.1 hypothetical protein VIBNIPon4_530038 [Vibrio nigripulchritudo POn4]
MFYIRIIEKALTYYYLVYFKEGYCYEALFSFLCYAHSIRCPILQSRQRTVRIRAHSL